MKEKEILKGIALINFASLIALLAILANISVLGFAYLVINNRIILGLFFLCSSIFMFYQVKSGIEKFNKILE